MGREEVQLVCRMGIFIDLEIMAVQANYGVPRY